MMGSFSLWKGMQRWCVLPVLFLLLTWTLPVDTSISVDPGKVVISLAVDASSLEIQYEAIRLLVSLQLNGGTLRSSRVAICVSYDGIDESVIDPQLIASLQQFNPWLISYSKRFSPPIWSPTLNKLCAFDPPGMNDDDYLLYLDADIFVLHDPMIQLSKHAEKADIVCGRPWNTFVGLQGFYDFVGGISVFENIDKYPMLDSFAGGTTLYGMCNTGMYFMSSIHSKKLIQTARAYLDKAMGMGEYTHTIPYAPSYFGIDSVILWAAQYYLNYTVDIVATRLNYMAPVEGYMKKFLDREKETIIREIYEKRLSDEENGVAHGDVHSRSKNGGIDVEPRETEMSMNGEVSNAMYDFDNNHEFQSLLADVDRPVLVHFSKGSELIIEYRPRTPISNSSDIPIVAESQTLSSNGDDGDNNTEKTNSSATMLSNHLSSQVCVVIMRGHLKEDGGNLGNMGKSRLLPLVFDLIDNETACRVYANALLSYGQGMSGGSIVT